MSMTIRIINVDPVSGKLFNFCGLLLLTLLTTACTPTHLYTGPAGSPVALLQATTTIHEDRDGESLRESYLPAGIDGKTLRANYRSAAIDGQYHLLPGPHKILVRSYIRRGGIWGGTAEYAGVIPADFAPDGRYRVNGAVRFADNALDLWIEDGETGSRVSDLLTLELTKPVPRPDVMTYPVYLPIKGWR